MTNAANNKNSEALHNTDAKSNGVNKAVDISAPGVASQLSRRVKADIDDYCIETYDDGFRWHLGASLIGQECQRAAWYGFRWAGVMTYSGATPEERKANHARMQRLFNRGHREEFRFVEFLRGTGWQVFEFDTSKPKKENGEYPQFRVTGFGGHFGGSLDGIGIPPARYNLPEGTAFLLEFKTNGTGAGFQKLKEKGAMIAKEQHFAQMSTYGSDPNFRLSHALYLNVCKNDDDLHVEIVKLDWALGDRMRTRAEKIITSQIPPLRLSDNPTFWKCKNCDFFKQCHENGPLPKNCRSCKFAKPVDGGEWLCEKVGQIIPRDFVPQGCNEWRSVNNV